MGLHLYNSCIKVFFGRVRVQKHVGETVTVCSQYVAIELRKKILVSSKASQLKAPHCFHQNFIVTKL